MPPPLDRLCYFNMNSEFTIKRNVHIPLMIHYLNGIIPPNIQQPVKQWHASSIVDWNQGTIQGFFFTIQINPVKFKIGICLGKYHAMRNSQGHIHLRWGKCGKN